MNLDLQRLYDEDQADRERMFADPGLTSGLEERDRERRTQVEQMLDAGEVRDGVDHYNAAMLFQHGETLDDYWKAHTLALRAVELGHRPARWLAAAAHDRWLMNQGKPQKYGTQFVSDGRHWRPWDVDPRTTDADRAEWDVPPLNETEAMMHKYYGGPPPLDPERAPQWLKDALRRWGV